GRAPATGNDRCQLPLQRWRGSVCWPARIQDVRSNIGISGGGRDGRRPRTRLKSHRGSVRLSGDRGHGRSILRGLDEMTDEADAIVVGSGINGLVAAAELARAGWSGILLERDAEGGGVGGPPA